MSAEDINRIGTSLNGVARVRVQLRKEADNLMALSDFKPREGTHKVAEELSKVMGRLSDLQLDLWCCPNYRGPPLSPEEQRVLDHTIKCMEGEGEA